MSQYFDSEAIIRFYSGISTDACGRRLEEIWKWDHVRLEVVHDYIQWLFPLSVRSQFNPDAPVLTDHTVEVFRWDSSLRMRLKRSLKVMLDFYGLQLLELDDGSIHIKRAVNFAILSHKWLTPGNHNHLRLTRIICSLKILGLETYSTALFNCLTEIYESYPEKISPITYQYWSDAAPTYSSEF
jgi:hypothetical protein